MRTSRSRRCAGALLTVVVATLLLPLVALASAPSAVARAHGCRCPVKMACCEAGLCHSDEDPSPASAPSWSGCRDEAPHRAELPPPSSELDPALLPAPQTYLAEGVALLASETPGRPEATGPAPSTPPPRRSVASR